MKRPKRSKAPRPRASKIAKRPRAKPASPITRPDGDGLLGLVMIVKDEAHGIARTLETFAPFIDHWTILDTGSTDGTQKIVRRALVGIPGKLYQERFVDFSVSRNRALELHGQATRFTIMPDSDDRLVNGGELRPFLIARTDAEPAYMASLRRGELSYYLPIVLRTAAGWRYHGAVHEYVGPATGDGFATVQIPDVQIAQEYVPQSAIASRKRWQRDLRVLRAELAKTPNDARTLFYLAQTYECLTEPANALTMYERRIAVGGWPEETFEASLRRAKILQALGRSWDVIERAYLDAHAVDPQRAEPLFKIAEHYYCNGDHANAYSYALRAAELPRPATTMFVDEEIYTWKAADIVAISGFYVDKKANGKRFARVCVQAKPHDERMRTNLAFYAPSAVELFPGYISKPIDFTTTEPWSPYNPSVFLDATGRWRCIVRTSNYKILNGHYLTPDDNVIHTRNFMLELDDALETMCAVEMIDKTGIPRSGYPCHGFEDCRLFAGRDGALRFTATVCDFDLERAWEGPREIVLGELDDDYTIARAVPLRGAWSAHAQKNWMPIVDANRRTTELVYATSPNGGSHATVLRLDDDAIHAIPDGTPLEHGRLRGSSHVVSVPGGWLGLVHDVAWSGAGRIYLHRFVFFNDAYRIVSMTEPFWFEIRGIEFCAGLAYDGDRLVASFGVADQHARFGIVSLDAVRSQLRTDYHI